MKNKFILCLCAVAVVALFWLLHSGEKTKLVPMAETLGTNVVTVKTATPPGVGTREASAGASSSTGQTAYHVATVAPEEKVRAVVEGKNAPIEFWGVVVDQADTPLSGVNIESQIRHWDFTAGVGTSGQIIKKQMTTGTDGRFYIGGDSGDDLMIKMEKSGYELEPNAKLDFGYNTAEQFTSQADAPFIFKMWSTNVHEQLVSGGKSFRVEPDGRAYVIDLAKGTIAESGDGDLKVWIKRPAQVTLGQRYDWTCEVDAINGGLLAEDDATSSMYLAPAEGYSSSFKFEQKVGSGWGDSTGDKRFYIRLNNGQVYGRIAIELFAYYNERMPGMVRVRYALNPSGSRILR